MRCAAFFASILVGAAVAVPAQTKVSVSGQVVDPRTRAELESAREAVWRAWFAGDSASLEKLIPAALAAGAP